MDPNKAELYRAQVINSSSKQAPPDSSASLTHSLGPAGARPAPQDDSPDALPDQAVPGASAPHVLPEQATLRSESAVSETPVLSHGKKRKADTECIRPAADTEAEAAMECGGQTGTESQAKGASSESNLEVCKKISRREGGQGTLQAAFAKTKVHD